MEFFFGLLNTIGNVIDRVFNIYGSYKQITDGSDNRQNHYEHHEYHHYDGKNSAKELSAIKEIVEKKLIPDIMNTTEIVRNVMKEIADSGQQLTEQIKKQLIPDAKAIIKTINETLPAVNETLKVAKDAFSEISNTSRILGDEISHAADQLHIGLEIGLIFLLLIVAAFCRYELSMIEQLPELKILNRIEKMVIRILRYICISYGIMRFVIIILLKQAEPVTSDVLFVTIIPVLICLLYDIVKQSNSNVSKPDVRMIYCECKGFLQHMGKYPRKCVNFITERSLLLCSYFKVFKRWSTQKMRHIKNYIQRILRHIGNKLVTAINIESVPLFTWLPQKYAFLLLHLKRKTQ